MHTIHSVRDQFGVAILLIEHDMNFVMGICEGDHCAGLRPCDCPRRWQIHPQQPEGHCGISGEVTDDGRDASVKNINVFMVLSTPSKMCPSMSMRARSSR